ncbi:hypothetical protein KUCAC02_023541 [Chaenocephalus aceratus]|uniref:Uncharacterized protein n=1 Tax=Chaenocephalus aceratus TaxID=36190 RepID=A0ACB9XQE5_CHAAC|nr:hypothetical protein KUCAC02_023541 [Chaenocephalus aceratus]
MMSLCYGSKQRGPIQAFQAGRELVWETLRTFGILALADHFHAKTAL